MNAYRLWFFALLAAIAITLGVIGYLGWLQLFEEDPAVVGEAGRGAGWLLAFGAAGIIILLMKRPS